MNNIFKSISKISLPVFVSLVFLFLYIPIVILVFFSFTDSSAPVFLGTKSFSLKWYYALLESPEIWRAFYISTITGVSATFLSLFISLSLIYYNLMTGSGKNLLYAFYANIVIPEIVIAVGLLTFLSYLNIELSLTTLIISHTILGLGYTIPIIYSRYLSMDKKIIESSMDLGATLTQTFFKIVIPSLMPAIFAAGLLAFIISFDDFILSFFLSGSQTQTLSILIYSMIRTGTSAIVNALSTIMLIISSFLVLIFCSLNTKTKIF